jgi:hypothetical protein
MTARPEEAGMNFAVALAGLAVLVGVAVVIGLAQVVDSDSRGRAWRGIAAERRRSQEERRQLQQLAEAIEWCRDCPFRSIGPDDRSE